MTAGILSTLAAGAGGYSLSIGGKVIGSNPNARVLAGDEYACTITQSTSGEHSCRFTIEDKTGSAVAWLLGDQVRINDQDGYVLFSGHLMETEITKRPGGGRLIDCTAAGHDQWLDWRVLPRSKYGRDTQGFVNSIQRDDVMIEVLLDRFGGGRFWSSPDYIEQTNASMPDVGILGMTLREAIERVAESATTRAESTTRHFFVDVMTKLWYYRDAIDDYPAPYRITDQTATTVVLATSGLVSLWRLAEATGSTLHDASGYANGAKNGTITLGNVKGQNAGVVNEPGLPAPRFDGSTGYVSATGANLHPGDTFTIEFWFRRASNGGTQTVWSGGTDDVEVGFNSSNRLVVYKEGTGDHFVSDDSFTVTTVTTSRWRHVVVARSPGATSVYVDGVALTGTTTARTFAAGSGAINIGRRKSGTDRYFDGWLQFVAVYSTKMSAANALAHRKAGASLVAEEMRWNSDAWDGREAVYVAGKNAEGSGWVRPNLPILTRFGRDGQQERQEIIVRDDSGSVEKRDSYGAAHLKTNRDPAEGLTFTVVGFDGWRAGQVVTVDDATFGLTGRELTIDHLETDVGFGANILTHTITAGKPIRSGTRQLGRRTRRQR